ncbi:hypothetical protein ALC60_07947 [Trachymyrmex zeteki]|uniref:Uncharacterized protein n=1 Tax=Mycetomoellerius zeteki TaxID=64791 RepID=A0A151WYB6_9HYME|nr:hypothetical protein ALC60_07947 [Trachymyrmex zeteki]
MQKRGTCGNAKRRGSQIDVGATRIVESVSKEQYGMENKGKTKLVAFYTICKRDSTLITLLRDITKRILRTFDHQHGRVYSVLRLFAIKQDYSLISSLSRSTPLGYLIKELHTHTHTRARAHTQTLVLL